MVNNETKEVLDVDENGKTYYTEAPSGSHSVAIVNLSPDRAGAGQAICQAGPQYMHRNKPGPRKPGGYKAVNAY